MMIRKAYNFYGISILLVSLTLLGCSDKINDESLFRCEDKKFSNHDVYDRIPIEAKKAAINYLKKYDVVSELCIAYATEDRGQEEITYEFSLYQYKKNNPEFRVAELDIRRNKYTDKYLFHEIEKAVDYKMLGKGSMDKDIYRKLQYLLETDCSNFSTTNSEKNSQLELSERNPDRKPWSVIPDDKLYFEYTCNLKSGLTGVNMDIPSSEVNKNISINY